MSLPPLRHSPMTDSFAGSDTRSCCRRRRCQRVPFHTRREMRLPPSLARRCNALIRQFRRAEKLLVFLDIAIEAGRTFFSVTSHEGRVPMLYSIPQLGVSSFDAIWAIETGDDGFEALSLLPEVANFFTEFLKPNRLVAGPMICHVS